MAGGHHIDYVHVVATGTPLQQVVGDSIRFRVGETVGVDLPRAARDSGLQRHQGTPGPGRPHRRAYDPLEDIFVTLVRGEVGDHALQLLESGLEQMRARLEVLGTRRRLITLHPAESEQTGAAPPALALLLDDLCRLRPKKSGISAYCPAANSQNSG